VSIAGRIHEILLDKADAIVRRAADRLDALIHPDFVYVNASGRTFDKAGYIEAYCTSGRSAFEAQRFSDLSVQVSPGVAEATFIAHDNFVVDGQPVAATYQSLCVFVEGPDGWQWIAGQTRTAG
jgi:ketosteroid isomerase-like protein